MIAQKFIAGLYVTLAAIMLAGSALAVEETPIPAPTLNPDTGAGDLMVAPTRAVLEGRTRAMEIVLNNKGTKEATYRISFAHLQMQQDGQYKELSEADAKATIKTADDMLRYSPKQVTLKPGESQVVKIMVRKPEGLADGEYTSHLLFHGIPDASAGQDVEAKATNNDQISVRLIPIYGVSIPVLVRQGELSSTAKLENPRIQGDTLSVTVARSGTRSIYGDIIVTQSGTKNVVGQMKGIGVLSYLDKRIVPIQLSSTALPLTIEYRQREEDGNKVLDKVEIK